MKILNRGLKFAPDKSLDKFNTYIDLHKFIRTLNLKKYFVQQPGISGTLHIPEYTHSNLKEKSTFMPYTTNNECIEAFKKATLKDLDNLQIDKK